jgi:hypothetical protein
MEETDEDRDRAVIVVMALSLSTVILSAFLLSAAEPEPVSVRHWIAAVGMFHAIYIEFYWLYVAWQSCLYRQNPNVGSMQLARY